MTNGDDIVALINFKDLMPQIYKKHSQWLKTNEVITIGIVHGEKKVSDKMDNVETLRFFLHRNQSDKKPPQKNRRSLKQQCYFTK